jgi:excinuclease UvrABC nuclease subunit
MNENRRKLVILLAALLAVFILNSGAAIAQTPSEEALKAWQQLSEEEKQRLRERYKKWDSLTTEQKATIRRKVAADLFRFVQHLSNLGSQCLHEKGFWMN